MPLNCACAVLALLAATPAPTASQAAAGKDSAPRGPAAPGAPAQSEPDRAQRLALFHSLVAAARAYHVTSATTEKNLGRTFEHEVPALEEEFAAAEGLPRLIAAVKHFQNSLHDAHCSYNPPSPPRTLTAGFEAEVEWVEGRPRFFVARVEDPELARLVAPGDYVAELDGVGSERFLAAFRLESNANHPRALSRDLARFISRRRTPPDAVAAGDRVRYVFQSRATGKRVKVERSWQPPSGARTFNSPDIDYSPGCGDLPPPSYGPYALRQVGVNFCLYVSEVPPHDAFPVVRQHSFAYQLNRPGGSQQLVRLDHDLLASSLAALPKARGVLLDLRENAGGNNPNWFLDWWAPRPYVDRFVDVRLHEDFADRRRLEKARATGWGPDAIDRYLAALKARAPGQAFMARRPFFCRDEACGGDNRYTPSHPVTRLPVALLVGPGCISSCDSFALTFRENRFGPLVGEPPAAAYTAFRIEHRVEVPDLRLDLGFVRFAFSRDVSGQTGEPVEGQVLALDAPVDPTFENRERYDALLVDAAIEALGKFESATP